MVLSDIIALRQSGNQPLTTCLGLYGANTQNNHYNQNDQLQYNTGHGYIYIYILNLAGIRMERIWFQNRLEASNCITVKGDKGGGGEGRSDKQEFLPLVAHPSLQHPSTPTISFNL